MGLIGTRNTYEEVAAVPTPARTPTWGVVGHTAAVDIVRSAARDANFNISSEEFCLAQKGSQLFGIAHIEEFADAKSTIAIGYRNSVNKTLGFATVVGPHVTVCSNLVLSGKVKYHTIHKGGLTIAKLYSSVLESFRSLAPDVAAYRSWMESIGEIKLTRQDKDALTMRALETGLITSTQVGYVYELFYLKHNEDNGAHYEDTLEGFQGAVTQLWNKRSLIGSETRHVKLNRFLAQAQLDMLSEGRIINLDVLTKEERQKVVEQSN
jgi:hypothetical protein